MAVADKLDRHDDHVLRLLERPSRLAHPAFEPSTKNLESLHNVRVLVVGAGGLGCELLKNLALSGFGSVDVIDMDTIDLSNLNRQFLFRLPDVGKFKAEVAAKFVTARVPSCNVTAHCCKIQDKDEDFYRSFNIVICGLDSIVARRWLNAMMVGLVEYDDDGELVASSVRCLVDGGTEGFKGNSRVILPGLTPCVECTLDLYPPQINFPLCTIAHTPRLPEHCVEYVKVIQWEKEAPFDGQPLDGDNADHVQWVFGEASKRAAEFGIPGVTYRLAQGVLKRIIPAVASTNAVIAASCALEALKFATNCALSMNNYMNFTDLDGIYFGVVELQKREDCLQCSRVPQKLCFAEDTKLKIVVEYIKKNYQMHGPSITAPGVTLYMEGAKGEQLVTLSRQNIQKSLKKLNLCDGIELSVTDETLAQPLDFRLHLLATAMEQT